MSRSTALHTDRYELTMLDAALRDGTASRRCVFEVFGRRLSGGRRFGVVAGTGRLLEAIRDFRSATMSCGSSVTSGWWMPRPSTSSPITASPGRSRIPRGRDLLPRSPLLTVEGTFAEAVLLETLALSILNYDSAVATAAARMSVAARPPARRDGLRRASEEAAVAAARPRTSPDSRPPATSRPDAAGESRPWAPQRTRGRCCTTPKKTRSARRSRRSAPARPC